MLTLMGKLWGVNCEDLEENQQCYNSPALYDNSVEELEASWMMYLYSPISHYTFFECS